MSQLSHLTTFFHRWHCEEFFLLFSQKYTTFLVLSPSTFLPPNDGIETDRPFVNSNIKHKRSRKEEVSRKELCERLASCTRRNEKIERVGEEREKRRKARCPR